MIMFPIFDAGRRLLSAVAINPLWPRYCPCTAFGRSNGGFQNCSQQYSTRLGPESIIT